MIHFLESPTNHPNTYTMNEKGLFEAKPDQKRTAFGKKSVMQTSSDKTDQSISSASVQPTNLIEIVFLITK